MSTNWYDQYGQYNQQYGGGSIIGGPNIDPNTGLPVGMTMPVGNQATQNPNVSTGSTSPTDPNIDPTTGQPYPTRVPRNGAGPQQESPITDPGSTPPSGVLQPAPGPYYPGTTLQQDPQFGQLTDLLMNRAQQPLNIDPLTDPIIQPQVADYGATQTRMANKAIDQQAEGGSPYSTGAQQNARTQANENAGFNTANLQSSLMTNELTARRQDIQNAMQTEGGLLTADQQLKLQNELGLIDANLKQQGLNSQNDQFLATLGLNINNQNSYLNAAQQGQI